MAITQNGVLKKDDNDNPVMGGTSSSDNATIINSSYDPVTRRLLTDNSAAAGTVTSVSVVSANGFAGTVATATTTPAITLSTTITGILKGNGTAISAATAGTDYVTASSTNTFTNKTYDTAGAGNVFSINGTAISAVTGTGAVVLASSPTLVTPALGTPTALVGTNITGTAAGLSIGGNAATATTATTATNLAGGSGGTVPYQSAAGTTAMLANGSAGQVLQSNGTTLAPSWAAAPAAALTVGSTAISSGTTTRILYDNAGTLGEYTLTGTGTVVVMATSPTITTAVLGSSTATTQAPADNSTKLATTAYVDNAILGQRQKEAVKYASIAALPSIVYANGSSGVGATLTGVALGAISLDSSSPSVADRVLIKNQVAPEQNGIYVVTAAGSGAAVFILTRATDFDQASDIQTGDTAFVTAGSTLANTTWTYNGIDSPTMGTTALTFVQAAGPGSYTAGNGITITGVSIAIDTAVTVDKTTVQTLTNKTLTSPTLTTPSLGVATATSINKITLTTPATGSTLTLIDGKTLTINKTISLTAADDTGVYTLPTGTKTLLATDGAGTSLTGIPYTLTGTANQVVLSAGTGNITFSLPQSIATSSNPQFATIELGAASDTTLSRVSAGLIAVEGVTVVDVSTSQTLTTKTLTSPIIQTSPVLATATNLKFTVPTGDVTGTGITTNEFNSGYSSTAIGDLVYLDSSSNWQKADADASAATYSSLLGIALSVTASASPATVLLQGFVYAASPFPTFTIGAPIYMSATAGAVTQTAPSTTDSATRIVGYAIHADKMWFNPSNDWITHT